MTTTDTTTDYAIDELLSDGITSTPSPLSDSGLMENASGQA